MSVYRFGQSSPIDEIAIRKSAGGGMRAFLFANEELSPESYEGIKTALTQQYWQAVPSEYEGRPCLEVRGARKLADFESVLRPNGFLTGGASLISKGGDEKFSVRERASNNLLWVYGFLNIIADAGFIAYGAIKKRLSPEKKQWEDLAASVAYASGSIVFTAFGRGDKSDHHLSRIANKLQDKLQGMGLTPATNSAAHIFAFNQRSGLLNRIKRFMHKYPSEIGNIAYATAGGFVATGALRTGDPSTKVFDSALGVSTMTAGITAAAVKEQAPDPNAPEPKGIFAKALQYVHQRPNSIAGVGYGFSSIVHTVETVRHFVSAPKDHPNKASLARLAYGMRGVFGVGNLIAEFVLTLASKGHGNGVKSDKSVDETAYSLVADAILHQPEQAREGLIKDLSTTFLANPDVLGGKPELIEAELRQRVTGLAANPWRAAPGLTREAAPAAPEDAAEKASWQERQMKRDMAAAAMQPAMV